MLLKMLFFVLISLNNINTTYASNTAEGKWTKSNVKNKIAEVTEVHKTIEAMLDIECEKLSLSTDYVLNVKELDVKQFSDCGVVRICNSSFCLSIERKSVLFGTQIERDVEDFTILGKKTELKMLDGNEWKFQVKSINHRLRNKDDEYSNKVNHHETFKPLIKNVTKFRWDMPELKKLETLTNALLKDESKSWCEDKTQELVVEGIGLLPDCCSFLHICNGTFCTKVSHVGVLFSKIHLRVRDTDGGLNNQHRNECFLIEYQGIGRKRRAAVSTFIRSETKRPVSTLSFNLPGYRYCGPGTDIEKMDDDGGPINELDAACRQHDVDYLMGEISPHLADVVLVNKVQKISPLLYPLFLSAFTAKEHFEGKFGFEYTSFLYFYPKTFQPSLTLFFSQYSTLNDTLNKKYGNSSVQSAIKLENVWKSLLQDIWLGSCYKTTWLNYTKPFDGNGKTNSPAETVQSSPQQTPAESPSSLGQIPNPLNLETEEASSTGQCELSVDTNAFPTPPKKLGSCYIVISEVAPSNTESTASFVEHQKVCPHGAKEQKSVSLNGYLELFFEAGAPGHPPEMIMSADFSQSTLFPVTENLGKRKIRRHYFLFGNELSNLDLSVEYARTTYDNRGIPSGLGRTICVVLLYIPNYATVMRGSEMKNLIMNRYGNGYLKTPLTEVRKKTIEQYIQDVIIYGEPCMMETCEVFLDWLAVKPQVETHSDTYYPITTTGDVDDGTSHYMSINRCTNVALPMQINDWEIGNPTPKRQNECATEKIEYPFSFRGVSIQSTAQKMLLNLKIFFTEASLRPQLLSGNPTDVVASAVNIHRHLIYQIEENYKKDLIKTPAGRKRPRVSTFEKQFDSFRIDVLHRLIQSYYSRNEPPLASSLYEAFKLKMKDDSPQNRGDLTEVAASKPFTCSEKTFRKYLRKFGYKYGQINMRDVVLQRDDIIAWRGRYLRALRANNKLEPPLPIVYTDETWIDPFARTGKAWVPKQRLSPRERRKYSYATNKVGRGPRLIVLHAGGSDGMIHEAMKVYPVSKKEAGKDYHSNVDSRTYMQWFLTLLNALDGKGSHIIVMDNAPYHGQNELPKLSQTKLVLYEWIRDNVSLLELLSIKPIEKYRKWELWEKVKAMKGNSKFFLIDKEAAKRGHRVLRLPPYNCDLNPIELVWKDIKHDVRKLNRDQNIATVQATAERVMLNYPVVKWKAHVGWVNGLAERYWNEDGHYESLIENQPRIIIPLNDDDTDDEMDEDDDEEDETVQDTDPIRSAFQGEDFEEEREIDDDTCDEAWPVVAEEPAPSSSRNLFPVI